MEFCPKCKGILMPQKQGDSNYLLCLKCGHKKDLSTSFKIKTSNDHKDVKKEVVIVDETAGDDLKPKVKKKCPDCGHDEAFFWSIQTRASDEPETKFFKCIKCKKTWREYK